MAATDEEARAQEYRRQQQAREDNRVLRERAMAGSPGALAGLRERTAGLLRWKGWDPIRRIKSDVTGEDVE